VFRALSNRSDYAENIESAGEEGNAAPRKMPIITIGGAAVQGAVWNGEQGKLPGPFRGSHGKDVEYEEVQPSLVAARRHIAYGGDRLQSQLHEQRRELWTGNERRIALRRNGVRLSGR
jgi:hypothetical protein